MTKLLTATTAKNAKPEEATYTLPAGESLHLQISPKGTKSWIFRYRIGTKPYKKVLGKYPALTLEQAKKKRDVARSSLANDIDPFPKKVEEAKKEKTFKEWSKYYLQKVEEDVSEAHLSRTVKGFKADVYPYIGNMGMNDIKAKHIINIVNIMADRDAKESAKKVFSSISRCFQVCMANFPDDIERNPTRDVALKDILGKSKVVHYPIITDDKKLGMLLKDVSTYSGEPSTRLALMMIAHVFVRPHNVRFATWEEIDFKTKQWIIPAHKMKTRKELIVPLSTQVLKILEEAKALNPDRKQYKKQVDRKLVDAGSLIFPSMRSVTTQMSDASMVSALRRMGYSKNEIVAHSFRGIFSTIAHEAGRDHAVIETQLAHSVGSQVSQAYNRAMYLNERTELMQWYSDHLEHIQSDEVQEG